MATISEGNASGGEEFSRVRFIFWELFQKEKMMNVVRCSSRRRSVMKTNVLMLNGASFAVRCNQTAQGCEYLRGGGDGVAPSALVTSDRDLQARVHLRKADWPICGVQRLYSRQKGLLCSEFALESKGGANTKSVEHPRTHLFVSRLRTIQVVSHIRVVDLAQLGQLN